MRLRIAMFAACWLLLHPVGARAEPPPRLMLPMVYRGGVDVRQ